jgi:hypothetical protein
MKLIAYFFLNIAVVILTYKESLLAVAPSQFKATSTPL